MTIDQKNKLMSVLSHATHMIKHLQKENAILSAQMEVVRIFGRCSDNGRDGSGGMLSEGFNNQLEDAVNMIAHMPETRRKK